MRFLRTNTAVRLTVGPFFDKTDGITPETALTATNEKLTFMVDDSNVPTLVIDANATASGGNNDLIHVTGDDSGFYDLELTAAQTNYLGRAILSITYATDHCPVFHEFMILPAMTYDSLVLGTDVLNADVTQFGGSNLTAASGIPEVKVASLASGAITASAIADGALTAAKFASGAFDAVWSVATRTLSSFGTLAADVWSSVTRTLTAGTNIVLAKGVGVTGLNDLSAAQVNAEADTAIADAALATAANLATLQTTATAIDAKTTNLPSDPADQSLIIAATNGIASAIAALNNVSTADLATALSTYDAPTKAEMDAGLALLATASSLATAKTAIDGIKTKTDSLTFTEPGFVDVNVQYINDVELAGTGVLGDEMGPA